MKKLSKILGISFEALLLGDDFPATTSEEARVIAREYDKLPAESRLRIMTLIFEELDRQRANNPYSADVD